MSYGATVQPATTILPPLGDFQPVHRQQAVVRPARPHFVQISSRWLTVAAAQAVYLTAPSENPGTPTTAAYVPGGSQMRRGPHAARRDYGFERGRDPRPRTTMPNTATRYWNPPAQSGVSTATCPWVYFAARG
jgi:hypothetical protein